MSTDPTANGLAVRTSGMSGQLSTQAARGSKQLEQLDALCRRCGLDERQRVVLEIAQDDYNAGINKLWELLRHGCEAGEILSAYAIRDYLDERGITAPSIKSLIKLQKRFDGLVDSEEDAASMIQDIRSMLESNGVKKTSYSEIIGFAIYLADCLKYTSLDQVLEYLGNMLEVYDIKLFKEAWDDYKRDAD